MTWYVCNNCENIVTITAYPVPAGQVWECDRCGDVAVMGSLTTEYGEEAKVRERLAL